MKDERRLLGAMARRQPAAWSEMYDRHVREVFGFVYHLLGGDGPLAEELHQEVWLKALEGFARFDPRRGSFRDAARSAIVLWGPPGPRSPATTVVSRATSLPATGQVSRL